jgi:hypothetical protein
MGYGMQDAGPAKNVNDIFFMAGNYKNVIGFQ